MLVCVFMCVCARVCASVCVMLHARAYRVRDLSRIWSFCQWFCPHLRIVINLTVSRCCDTIICRDTQGLVGILFYSIQHYSIEKYNEN